MALPAHRVPELEQLRPLLWGLAYRMTGAAEEADDVVQDALLRAWERPPGRLDEPLRAWLVAVTLNLGRDRLRARKRRAYVGPWLPTPVPDARLVDELIADRESASWAFLCAAERLSATQRAVFLAREVLELSAAETGAALGCSPAAVDTALLRARAALVDLPAAPTMLDDGVVVAFLTCLQLGMTRAAIKLLHPDAVAVNDGGGVVNAARVPVVGARKIVTFFKRLARLYPPGVAMRLARCNGLLTVVGEAPAGSRGAKLPASFTLCATVEGGRITRLYSVLAPTKLAVVLG